MQADGWTYYDFGTNWSKYHEIWVSDTVQDVLEPDMRYWAAMYSNREAGGSRPVWKRGADLWTYGHPDFYCYRWNIKATDYIYRFKLIRRFREAVRRAGRRDYSISDALDDFFELGGMGVVYEVCEPTPKSWEANVLDGGNYFLADAQAEAARMLFPGEDVRVAYRYDTGESPVPVVPGRKLIVDFVTAFLYEFGKIAYADCSSDHRLKQMYANMAPDKVVAALDLSPRLGEW